MTVNNTNHVSPWAEDTLGYGWAYMLCTQFPYDCTARGPAMDKFETYRQLRDKTAVFGAARREKELADIGDEIWGQAQSTAIMGARRLGRSAPAWLCEIMAGLLDRSMKVRWPEETSKAFLAEVVKTMMAGAHDPLNFATMARALPNTSYGLVREPGRRSSRHVFASEPMQYWHTAARTHAAASELLRQTAYALAQHGSSPHVDRIAGTHVADALFDCGLLEPRDAVAVKCGSWYPAGVQVPRVAHTHRPWAANGTGNVLAGRLVDDVLARMGRPVDRTPQLEIAAAAFWCWAALAASAIRQNLRWLSGSGTMIDADAVLTRVGVPPARAESIIDLSSYAVVRGKGPLSTMPCLDNYNALHGIVHGWTQRLEEIETFAHITATEPTPEYARAALAEIGKSAARRAKAAQ